MNYSLQELNSMIYAIGESDGNCFLASKLYAQKFPARRHPNSRSLKNLKERFERTGNVTYEKKSRIKRVLNEENQLAITLSVVENPTVSVREISRNLDIDKSSINKCIKINKLHPYHVQLHHELLERDHERRVAFCQWSQNQIREQRNFFKLVLFTDESTFHRNGFVNRHNFHYYDNRNPHILHVSSYQHKWTLNVWGGIIDNFVIGPHFFEERLNGAVMLRFLHEEFPRLTEHLPDYIKQNMWLQLDGAPPHFNLEVRQYLNLKFPHKWIGREGPINWPARSPDLTPMDFFLWGTVKSQVYREAATTRDDMKERIRRSFQNITNETLLNVRESFHKRLEKCVLENGRHFEHLIH